MHNNLLETDPNKIKDMTFEIFPGKYNGENYSNPNTHMYYISEHIYIYIEDIIKDLSGDKEYSHWGYSEIHKQNWEQILQKVIEIKSDLADNKCINFENYFIKLEESDSNKFSPQFKKELTDFIDKFINTINLLLEDHDYITIVGL